MMTFVLIPVASSLSAHTVAFQIDLQNVVYCAVML